MEEFVEIAGAGRLRATTAQDVERARQAAQPVAAPTPKIRSITASASRLRGSDSAYAQRLAQPWQNRTLSYYDQIGEIRFASQFYGKLLSRVRFFAALREDDGSLAPVESGLPVELLAQIHSGGSG